MQALNIVGYSNGSFEEAFQLYMENIKENSENTYKTYLGHYNEFFMYTLGTIENITWDDILSIKYRNIVGYRNYLTKIKKPRNSNQTANQKIAEIRALWYELKKYNNNIDTSVVNLKPLRIKTTNGSQALTESEVYQLLDFASNRDFKPKMQEMFFKIAIITALRKNVLFNLTWDDIKQHTDPETGTEYWCIDIYDKTDRFIKPLRDDIYEELLELKDDVYNTNIKINDNRIFKISEDTITKTLRNFCDEYNIDRKITLHSLRKTSSDIANIIAKGNIKKIQQQTGHKDPRVLIERYQGTRDSLSSFPGLSMFDDNISIDKLYQYSKEEIIDAISKCDISILRTILVNLK